MLHLFFFGWPLILIGLTITTLAVRARFSPYGYERGVNIAAICAGLALLIVGVLLLTAPAFADTLTLPPSPTTTTIITLPIGDWVNQIVPVLGEILAAGICGSVLWLLRQLPEAIRSKINDAQVAQADQLLVRAADYGLNTVAAEVKGKTVTVETGNAAAAIAVQYVVDHGPEKLVDFMGGPEAIAQKVIARLPISPAASPSSAIAVVATSPPAPAPT